MSSASQRTLVYILIGLTIGILPSQFVALKTYRMERLRSEMAFLLMATGVGQSSDDVSRWLGAPDTIIHTNAELRGTNPRGFVPSRPVDYAVWLYRKHHFTVYVYVSPRGLVETSYVLDAEERRR